MAEFEHNILDIYSTFLPTFICQIKFDWLQRLGKACVATCKQATSDKEVRRLTRVPSQRKMMTVMRYGNDTQFNILHVHPINRNNVLHFDSRPYICPE